MTDTIFVNKFLNDLFSIKYSLKNSTGINKTNNEKYKFKNKKVLCSSIANKLLSKNKLILLPLYKPK